MALTLAVDGPVEFAGTLKVVHGTATFDSSYPTGGEALSLSTLGLKRIDHLYIDSPSTHQLEWDGSGTAPTILAKLPTLTDNTTGTAGTTLAAGVGTYVMPFQIDLAGITDADILTTWTPGHKFKILSLDFFVSIAVTTGSKATTLNVEIGTTNTTGGTVALTSANCTPKGVKVAGSAITAANTGSASDTISIEASSTTAFAEGAGWILLTIQNMDTADALASLAASREVANATNLSSVVGRFTAIGV